MLRGSEKGGFLHKRYKLKFYGTFFTTRLPFKELLLNNFMIFHKFQVLNLELKIHGGFLEEF